MICEIDKVQRVNDHSLGLFHGNEFVSTIAYKLDVDVDRIFETLVDRLAEDYFVTIFESGTIVINSRDGSRDILKP
jgi:hypothetical protein